MKNHWKSTAEEVGREVKKRPGQLIGCAVDNDEKADAFIKFWEENHPHVEVIDRKYLLNNVFMRLRLRGSVQ